MDGKYRTYPIHVIHYLRLQGLITGLQFDSKGEAFASCAESECVKVQVLCFLFNFEKLYDELNTNSRTDRFTFKVIWRGSCEELFLLILFSNSSVLKAKSTCFHTEQPGSHKKLNVRHSELNSILYCSKKKQRCNM